jgi:hypothetical protein
MAKRSSSLSGLSISEIQAELRRRQRALPALNRKRSKLLAKIATIDAKIAELGGSVGASPSMKSPSGRRGGGRRPAEDSLVTYLQKALSGKTMGVAEVADAVKAAGYQTNSPNFRTIVNAALINKKHGFKRASRGQYTFNG